MQVFPFRGWRPRPELAAQVASRPYDVVTTEQAARLAEGKPYSFYHVTRSEIDLPAGTDAYDAKVYERAGENFRRFCGEGIFVRDPEPALYPYRLTMGSHAQTGLICCLSVDDYEKNVIKKHELTRPDKEEDRTRHILATRAHCGPVLIAYRRVERVDELVSAETEGPPLYRFTAEDGVEHAVWKARDSASLAAAFGEVPALYIADGHHRAASAGRARARCRAEPPDPGGDAEYSRFLAVVFPDVQLQILAYNRVVKGLNGMSSRGFLGTVGQAFDASGDASPVPSGKGRFSMFLDGRWYRLTPRGGPTGSVDPVAALDVSVLQERLLGPILGIADPRTDQRIDFVGGLHGTTELEERVRSGRADVAFALHPVSMTELMSIADRGGTMPPKSTWFEPKLRSGLVVHAF